MKESPKPTTSLTGRTTSLRNCIASIVPVQLRRVEYYDEEQDRYFVFLTNAMDITALEIALLYKNRWSVKLFFKWVKQHLKIKKFWGDSENAVRIQIYSAIISYCLVAIVHHKMKLKSPVYNTLQVIGI